MPLPSPSSPGLPQGDLDSVLHHSEWLQRLARRLVRDESTAQDLVQRVWLAALREPPEQGAGSVRGWLAAVLKNEARMERRSSGRRQEREQLAASQEAQPGAEEELVAIDKRFHLQQQLMTAVNALDEPFRTTVLLRYFEQQTVAGIAKRMDAPPRTVEARLRRGRELLRHRLDGHFGDRATWATLAMPLAAPASPSPSPSGASSEPAQLPPSVLSTLATVAMTSKALFAFTAVFSLIAAVQLLREPQSAGALSHVHALAEGTVPLDPVPASPVELVPVGDHPARAAGALDPEVADLDVPVAEGLELPSVTILALNADGAPYPELGLRLDPPLAGVDELHTQGSGEVEFEAAIPAGATARIVPLAQDVIVLAQRAIGPFLQNSKLPGLVILGSPRGLAGVVRDSEGVPVDGARIEVLLPDSFATRFSVPLGKVENSTWEASTEFDGGFEFASVPILLGCSLTVEAEGFKPLTLPTIPSPEAMPPNEALALTLESVNRAARVAGRVLDELGDPVEGAWVGLGFAVETTDAEGRFGFQLDATKAATKGPQRLMVAAKGWAPVRLQPALDEEGQPVWPDTIVIRMAQKALSIEGVVLDAAGAPKTGATVWINDPTLMGLNESSSAITAEELMGPDGYLWKKFYTDENGRFQIPGLGDRVYEVRAMDSATLHLCTEASLSAGTSHAVLQLDPNVLVSHVAGRVVDRNGDGLEGASLSLRRVALSIPHPGTSSANVAHSRTKPIFTDKEGGFDLGRLPIHAGTTLVVRMDNKDQKEILLTDIPAPLEVIEIALFDRCSARIAAEGAFDVAPEIAICRTASGEHLRLSWTLGGSTSSSEAIHLVEGNSPLFSVSTEAVEVLLMGKGGVVATLPLRLTPDGVNEITP